MLSKKWITLFAGAGVGLVTGSLLSYLYFRKQPKQNCSVPALGFPSTEDSCEDSEKKDEGVPGSVKMVIVVRTDLGMGKGKIAAQVGHAVIACYERTMKRCPRLNIKWKQGGQKKVCLRIGSERELLEIENKARENGLVTYVVRDAGRTQIPSNSLTVCGIGPDSTERIDAITRALKLL